MPSTLVATVGAANANAYDTVANGDTYFDNRLNASAWTGASADDKTRALLQATRWLDNQEFQGVKVAEAQALKWPRYWADDDSGYEYESDVIPQIIIDAMFELALRLLNDGTTDTLSDTGLEEYDEAAIGPLDVKRNRNFRAGQLPSHVRAILRPVLITAGNSVLMQRA